MTEHHSTADDCENPLYEVLTEYLEAAESGAKFDQTALLASNPELAAELSNFVETIKHLDRYTGEVRQIISRTATESIPQTFGDYELLGQIGRGGMGVVYRARNRV